jgi:hypothetical protein
MNLYVRFKSFVKVGRNIIWCNYTSINVLEVSFT